MVGARIKRREDPRLITGHAMYTDDVQNVGQLYLTFVRSPHAHAKINSINLAEAKKVPGVKAILLGDEINAVTNPLPAVIPGPEYRPISTGVVRYVGDIVAAVIADSRGRSRDAAELVEVDYEVLPACVDVEEAAKGQPTVIYEQFANNIGIVLEFGNDVSDAFANAEVIVEEKFNHQRLGANPMETRNVTAEYRIGEGQLTVYTSNQNPHIIKTIMSAIMNLPEQMIRIVAPEVGGGFGTKISLYREEVVCAYAAKKLGKSVKWNETRSEHLLASSQGRGQVDYVRMAATKDGVVTALDTVAYSDMGAYYTLFTPAIPQFTALVLNGVYAIPAVHYKSHNVLTNKTPTDAYRGAGRPEATYMIERMMDRLAEKLGMDPVDVRRKNFIPKDKFPFPTPMGMVYDTGDYDVALDKALEMVDYEGVRKMQAEAIAQGRYVGVGVCTYMEICGLGPSVALAGRGWESATIRFEVSGKVTVFTGASPHGQGQETTFSQIISDELGVKMEDITVKHGDTNNTVAGNGTYGSRGLAVGGAAIKMACDSIKEKATKIAGFMLEASAEDVEFSDGKFTVKGNPGGKSVSMYEVAVKAYTGFDMFKEIEPGLEATRFFEPQNFVFPFGAHIAVVEIDKDTGEVMFHKYVAVDDCGTQISPLLVEGQVHGGIAQGIAQALYEEIVYDENGQLISGTLMDYTVPTATELPSYTLGTTVTPTWVNPLGAKGVGEAGTIGSTPAVVNALMDALHKAGKNNAEINMPFRPEKLWKAING
jgi:carbon-monoxide dehydrogenase large subunit